MSETARVYSGRSPDERDAERRSRLLAAGRELFGTAGYAATSIERLCTEAKVSTRHFYKLYANKEEAFLDVYTEINRTSFEHAIASMAGSEGEPIQNRLPNALIAYLQPLMEDPRVAHIAFVEVMGVSPRVEESRLTQREALIELIEAEGAAAVTRGEVADRDFRFATLALAGAVNAIIYDWATGGSGADSQAGAEEVEAAIADLALTLLAR